MTYNIVEQVFLATTNNVQTFIYVSILTYLSFVINYVCLDSERSDDNIMY